MTIYIVSNAYELTGDSEPPKAFFTREKAIAYLVEKAMQEMEDIHELDYLDYDRERTDEEILNQVATEGRYHYIVSDSYGYRWISEVEVE